MRDRGEAYVFGPFRLITEDRVLLCQGQPVHLTPKVFETLVVLVQNQGHLVEKEVLIKRLWPDAIVEDQNLTVNIAALRKSLGKGASGQEYIETVPRLGYRFLAPVTKISDVLTSAQGMGNKGSAETDVRTAADRLRPRAAALRRWTAGAAAAALTLALGAVSYFRHNFRNPLLKGKDTIFLADFVNRTGDPAFDDALKHGLEAALRQSPFVNLLLGSEALPEWRRMQIPARTAMAHDVCRRAGSFAYVVGSISVQGSEYVLGLKAVVCDTGEAFPEEQTTAGSKQQALDAVNRQAAKLCRRLGELLVSARKNERPLGEARISSPEAPTVYAAERKAQSDKGAVPFFRRAVETRTTVVVAPTRAELGSLFTLTATVRHPSGNPVTKGSVTFYDEAAPLGTVQVVSTPSGGGKVGTATLKTILVPLRRNLLTAKYAGRDLSSTSRAAAATVTGKYPTTTTFTYRGSAGACTFTGTVVGAGPIRPTGTIAFREPTDGVLASTAALDPLTGDQTFVYASKVGGFFAPVVAAIADVNGDGVPDLFIGDSNGVTVQLGNGDGTFRSPIPVARGFVNWGLALGDFNGDGKLDVAATIGGRIAVLLGNGDGTFEAKGSFDSGSPTKIAVGDFNGDGVLDLVAINGSVDLLLGNGDGTFKAPVSYPASSARSLAVGDVNRDGHLDVVVGTAPHDVTIFLGNGNGTLRTGPTYVTQYEPGDMVLADLRGNGDLDLVTSFSQCCDGDNTSVNVMRGNGNGTFQAEYTILSGTDYGDLAVGDLNGDGIVDLVISDYGYPFINVLLGKGDGTFQSALSYPVGRGPISPAVADLNHDGRPDIVVENYNDGDAYVLLNQVTQTATRNNAVIPNAARPLLAAEYAGDTNFFPSASTKTGLIGTRNARGEFVGPCSKSWH